MSTRQDGQNQPQEPAGCELRASAGSASWVLRELEWSATYSYCTGWPCCPICRGIKPGHGADEMGRLPDNQGHRDGCRLAAAIGEPNSDSITKV